MERKKPRVTGPDVRLKSPLPCWHESLASARTDPLVSLSLQGGHIETSRPVPPGTPVFLELSLGQSLGAEKAEIDAVAEAPRPGNPSGFFVRFLRMDERARAWMEERLRLEAPDPVPAPESAPEAGSAFDSSFAQSPDEAFAERPDAAEPPAAFGAVDPFDAPSTHALDDLPDAFEETVDPLPSAALTDPLTEDFSAPAGEPDRRLTAAETAPWAAAPVSGAFDALPNFKTPGLLPAVGTDFGPGSSSGPTEDDPPPEHTEPWARAAGNSVPPQPLPSPLSAGPSWDADAVDQTRPWAPAPAGARPTPVSPAIAAPPPSFPSPSAFPAPPTTPPPATPLPRMASLDIPGALPATQSIHETQRWPAAQLRVPPAREAVDAPALPREAPLDTTPSASNPFGQGGGFLGADDESDVPVGGNGSLTFGFEATDPGPAPDDPSVHRAATVEDPHALWDEPAADQGVAEVLASGALVDAELSGFSDVLGSPVGPVIAEPAAIAAPPRVATPLFVAPAPPDPAPGPVVSARTSPPPLPPLPRATLPFGVPATTAPLPRQPTPVNAFAPAPGRTTDPLFPAVALPPGERSTLQFATADVDTAARASPPTLQFATADVDTAVRAALAAAPHTAGPHAATPAGPLLHETLREDANALQDALAAALPGDDAFELAFAVPEPPSRAAAHDPASWSVPDASGHDALGAPEDDDLPLVVGDGDELPVVLGAASLIEEPPFPESWVVPGDKKPGS